MLLSGLVSRVQQTPAFSQLIKDLEARPAEPIDLGAPRATRPVLVAALQRALRRPLLVLTTQSAEAWQIYEQLRVWAPEPRSILRYPEPDVLPHERMPWAVETRRERLNTLAALLQPQAEGEAAPVVVASARALLRKTLPPREFLLGIRALRVGQSVTLNNLLAHWYAYGYEAVQVVEEPGTYSRRGGIIDLFSPQWALPVRIELFGDTVDSLRQFDPATQRSLAKLDAVTVIPAREALPKFGPTAWERFSALDCSPCHSAVRDEFARDLQLLEQSAPFPNIEFYIPYLYSQPASLLDFVPQSALLVFDDLAQIEAKARQVTEQGEAVRRDMTQAGELPEGIAVSHFIWDELAPYLAARGPSLVFGYAGSEEAHALGQAFRPSPRYGGQLKRVLAEWQQREEPGSSEVIVSRQSPRLADLLSEGGTPTAPVERIDAPPPPGSLLLVPGSLPEGWTLVDRERDVEPAPVLVVLTDAEIFGLSKPEPRRPKAPRGAGPEHFFADISPGEYVVHIDHGVGLFRDLVRLTEHGLDQEYLQIDYAAGDHLYVPVYQVDRLSRYVGGGDAEPTLQRLGSSDWPRVKARARRAAEEIAEELLELYAARQVVPGYAYGPDTGWQHELEAAFPYVETQDQLDAIENVKADMRYAHPMDRLVCGDVGYGKTEVALRAAFKAVSESRQVAILVPTTVLAQQHFQTFRERLASFPVEVEMLSRFRSHKEQEDILDRLAGGQVDIVIGTHRLIQKDVAFKDLGLLIIDEEQRFGVAHKERLKQLRREVDVLTLTATPIPRTLYMALTGARDMSTIDTPPEERLPIKTRIAEYDDNLVRQAILREMNRGGQIYFVHNRVRGIEQIAQRVRNLVPEATVAVGHGQMPEAELERVMLDFSAGAVDVLVCTSIIESGLDIPNANTIIINRADHFGLAQLYQLRGRVGRSAVRAYAYLLYAPHQPLSEVASRRLSAIAEASELGAGFQVAMYDLEIRGAGEFLGRRQHGHIVAVGFDLYTRMLANAVERLKKQGKTMGSAALPAPSPAQTGAGRSDDGDGHEPVTADQAERRPREMAVDGVMADLWWEPFNQTVQITLPIAALLPESYVPDVSLRLQLYRRMARLRTGSEVEDMRRELEDRFGPLPADALDLLFQLRLKVLCLAAGVESIATDSGQIVVRFGDLAQVDRQYVGRKLAGKARLGQRQAWLPLDATGAWREPLVETLEVLAEARKMHAAVP